MSYVSLLKNIPEILSQPTGIAAIASVGIHGAIALIVPLMPVDNSQSKAASKSVGVMEISQADQNRLPQTPGSPQVGIQQLPPLPGQQQLALQPQIPSTDFNSQSTFVPPPPSSYTQPPLSPLPINPNNYRTYSLPSRQSFQLPKQDFRFDNSGFRANNPKFTSPVPSFDSQQIAQAPQPLPVERLPKLSSEQVPTDLANTPIPASSPNMTTANNITPQPTQVDDMLGNQNQNLAANINSTSETRNNPTTTTGSVANVQSQPAETTTLPKNAPSPTQISQLTSYEELRKALQQQYPNSEEKAVIRDTVGVSKAGVEGTVLGFLVVDPDGKVLDIKFQDKLLSPALQLKARQYFNAKSLKGNKQISRYPFNLRFQDSSKTAGVTPPINTSPSEKLSNPINNNQSTPAVSPPAKLIPLLKPTSSEIQPIPTPETTSKPLSTRINRNQLSSSQEANPKLIQTLREFREKRENSSSAQ
ncbi:hypothetical protein [Nostoc sp. FACHB-110]|uniref:hypothetical protein n=1 Tax=Nostoc sp. FACHB-110 TaxID=2692834 RepID=UPI001683C4CC|nr:hypothetical protein [Nostoc sp. FACHB-110]MBD2439057.1 hypothetical protein [Nostoc sp. FACHB-110]